jgi:ubiquinol-cytochrome c reductase core subunit 2
MNEQVVNHIKFAQNDLAANPSQLALESAHRVAFHRGLGNPGTPIPGTPLGAVMDTDLISEFARGAYSKSNIAVVASGAKSSDVSKWVSQFFKETADIPHASPESGSKAPQYFGGEERIPSTAGNAIVIAFPGSASFGTAGSAYKPEVAVLAALLGGQSSVKWSTGSSLLAKATEEYPQAHVRTNHVSYSDSGLLYITVSGGVSAVSVASAHVANTLKSVAAGEFTADDVKRATALAKFDTLEAAQSLETGIELTGTGLIHGGKPFQIAEVGQSIDKVTEQQVKEASAAAPHISIPKFYQ